MLNDFGIQHFHLGRSASPTNPQLIEGTRELLFAVVTPDSFYAIGIYRHGDWNKVELLDRISENWPELLEPFTLKGVIGLSRNVSDEEASKLRANGINVPRQRADGGVQFGMGGGVATDGSSIAVRMQCDKIILLLDDLAKRVEAIATSRAKEADPEISHIAIFMTCTETGTRITTEPKLFEVDASRHFYLPPL